jgi:hypothetical protein
MHYVGAIDEAQQNRLSGWAVSHVGDICKVTVVVNKRDRFVTTSNGDRPDLAAKQQSRGAGGFRVDIASALVPGDNGIEVLFPDGSHVPGSPFVRAMPTDWLAPPRPPEPVRAPTLTLTPKPPQLSLAELEDMSLDDVCHAVAHGIVRVVDPRPQPVLAPPLPAIAEPVAAAAAPPARFWLARLLARRTALDARSCLHTS